MSGWTATAWFLLLLPVLGRLAGVRVAPTGDWQTRQELGIALGAGLGFTGLSARWFWRYFLVGGGLVGGELATVCPGLMGEKNLTPAGWLLAQAVPTLGLEATLLWGAAVSQVLLGGALYLWGRALHGRLAGLLAVMLALSVAPLVLTARSLSFVPETTAGLAMLGAAVAIRGRSFFVSGFLLGAGAWLGGGAVDWAGSAQIRQMLPWAGPGGTALGLALVTLRGQPRQAVALGIGLVPVLAVGMVTGNAAWSLVGVPVLGALALLVLLPNGQTGWGRPAAGLVVVGLLAFGVLPTWLSPAASWRVPLAGAEDLQAEAPACQILLQSDDLAGRTHKPYGPAGPKAALHFGSEDEVFRQELARFDQNGDGLLSGAEYQNYGDPGDFAATDADANGTVSFAEWRDWLRVTQPRPQDRPFVNAALTLLATPESQASPPHPPHPPLPPAPVPALGSSSPPAKNRWGPLGVGVLGGVGVALAGLWFFRRRFR